MTFNQWATRWGIPDTAIDELIKLFGIDPSSDKLEGVSEAAVQQQIRLKASQQGSRLWRNNVGAVTTDDGRHIRYGLANDSSAINQVVKSSDLIGITPTRILPEMVGDVVGVFTAYEVKRGGWKYSETKRERAQLKFIQLVVSMGGVAKFINSPEDL